MCGGWELWQGKLWHQTPLHRENHMRLICLLLSKYILKPWSFWTPEENLHVHTKGLLIISTLLISWICFRWFSLRKFYHGKSPLFTTKNGSQYSCVTLSSQALAMQIQGTFFVYGMFTKNPVDYARIKFTQRTFVRIPRIFGAGTISCFFSWWIGWIFKKIC